MLESKRMDFFKILNNSSIWSWNGRIGRLNYFVNFCLFFQSIVVLFMCPFKGSNVDLGSVNWYAILFVYLPLWVISTYVGCCGLAKRVHDFNMTLLKYSLWFLLPIAFAVIAVILVIISQQNEMKYLFLPVLVFGVLSVISLWIWGLYPLFKKGNLAENRFGIPDNKVKYLWIKVVFAVVVYVVNIGVDVYFAIDYIKNVQQ